MPSFQRLGQNVHLYIHWLFKSSYYMLEYDNWKRNETRFLYSRTSQSQFLISSEMFKRSSTNWKKIPPSPQKEHSQDSAKMLKGKRMDWFPCSLILTNLFHVNYLLLKCFTCLLNFLFFLLFCLYSINLDSIYCFCFYLSRI